MISVDSRTDQYVWPNDKERKLLGLLAPTDLQVKGNKATVSESDESVTNSPRAPVMALCISR